jgi:CTP synthase
LKKAKEILSDVDGLVVPGGFGVRGIEGKLNAIRYARENNLPFLGLCLGMQCAVIEYARNVVGLKDANSMEFNEGTPYPVIDIMLEQKNVQQMGGTMRLGKYDCALKKGTKAYEAYGKEDTISERHRHRYEVNNEYREQIENAGLVFSVVGTGRYDLASERIEFGSLRPLMGYTVGVGVNLTQHLLIESRFTGGFKKTMNYFEGAEFYTRSSWLTLGIGYMF